MKKAANENVPEQRGEDFVTFALKPDAPDFVALGRARYAGEFRRSEQPFRATRGEWNVFLARTGFFEEVKNQELRVEGAESPQT
jgi:hypothetical protein